MRVNTLNINGEPAWTLTHDLAPLWSWMFEPSSITESRRLHNTLFDAAVRFDDLRRRTEPLPRFHEFLAVFEEITPDRFARELKAQPDAILSMSVENAETSRPYQHEEASKSWETFFEACEARDEEGASRAWEHAILSPLAIRGTQQHDARLLAGLALEMGLEREDRARALVWSLFGRPGSHEARALTETWVARAESLPSVAWKPKRTFWNWLRG